MKSLIVTKDENVQAGKTQQATFSHEKQRILSCVQDPAYVWF